MLIPLLPACETHRWQPGRVRAAERAWNRRPAFCWFPWKWQPGRVRTAERAQAISWRAFSGPSIRSRSPERPGDPGSSVRTEEYDIGRYFARLEQPLDGRGHQHDALDDLLRRDAVRSRLVGDLPLHERGAHVAGAYGVHRDALVGGLQGHRLREAQ